MADDNYLYPLGTNLDAAQVLKRAYDETENRLRVDAEVTAVIGSVSVIINAATDNIAIADAITGYKLTVNADGTINTNVNINDTSDSIKVGNGAGNYLAINNDGSVRTVQLFTKSFDAITAAYPSSTQEVYQSRVGGISGTVQETLTVNYTDSTKDLIMNVARS